MSAKIATLKYFRRERDPAMQCVQSMINVSVCVGICRLTNCEKRLCPGLFYINFDKIGNLTPLMTFDPNEKKNTHVHRQNAFFQFELKNSTMLRSGNKNS